MIQVTLIVLQFLFIVFLLTRKPKTITETETKTEVVAVPVETRRTPEFRNAPYKRYKPQNFQQMGVLLGPSGEILPLYGREARGYRDRYNYYTASPGEQIYSLTVTHKDRECTEDIGCPEFYGGEQVTVLGKSGNYTVKIYETEQIWYA